MNTSLSSHELARSEQMPASFRAGARSLSDEEKIRIAGEVTLDSEPSEHEIDNGSEHMVEEIGQSSIPMTVEATGAEVSAMEFIEPVTPLAESEVSIADDIGADQGQDIQDLGLVDIAIEDIVHGAQPPALALEGQDPTPAPGTAPVPPLEAACDDAPDPDLLVHALSQACFSGQFRNLTALLAAGANPNALGNVVLPDGTFYEAVTPIQAAILATLNEEVTPRVLRKQISRIVKTLLNHGAAVTEGERELVMHCANHNLAETLDALGEKQIRLRRFGFDIMGAAMQHGHLDVMKVMTRNMCSINIQNDRGNRPFLDICSKTLRVSLGEKKVVERSAGDLSELIASFVAIGLNLEATDKVGCTALMRAVVTGNETMATALLISGADPRVILRNGVSIPHLVAACMRPGFLRHFLSMTGTRDDLRRLKARRLQPEVRAIVGAAGG